MIIKQIHEYDGKYFISNTGRLFSFIGGNTKELSLSGKKYHCVCINKQNVLIHRIVAKYFLPKPKYNKMIVVHKDKNSFNNNASNLKYIQRSKLKQSNRNIKKGIDHPFHKLNEMDIVTIRQLHRKGYSHSHIHMIINKCTRRNITDIINKKTWKNL